MKFFDDKHIKNIALLGSQKSGKTTLTESMLFEAGLISRRGSVDHQNTMSDYHAIEHEREGSVHTTLLHTEWRNYKINIMDTPGLDEFVGEMIPAVRVADTAVFVINAQNGVEIGTELSWEYVNQFKKPSLFVVNQVDHPKSNFEVTVEQLKENFGNAVTVVQYPLNQGEGFNSIIDLLKMTMYVFSPEGGKPEKHAIPAGELEKAKRLHNELLEKAAENDEDLMNLFFEKGTLDEDEMVKGLKIGMIKHDVFPVFSISAEKNMGAGRLMGFIDNVAPSAIDALPEQTTKGEEIPHKVEAPTEVFVFKTQNEPNLGKMTFFKVVSGELKAGTDLFNHQTRQSERFNNLFVIDGHQRNSVDKLTAGDIGATLKLKDTHVNDTLSEKELTSDVQPMEFPEARITMAVSSEDEKDAEKISEALHRLTEEDPTVKIEHSKELKQLLVGAQGELHLSVIKWYLENVYNLNLKFESPKISYRETINKPAEAQYRHKKQSGGAGQFAEVSIKIEPYAEGAPDPAGFHVRERQVHDLEWGGKLEFINCIVGGAIDARFIPSILKGIMEKMESGPLTSSPIRDVRVILFDGKMHSVDSNDLAFKLAGLNAFKDAFMQASPSIMEPMYLLEVRLPEELLGDVLTDLQARRASILKIDSLNSSQIVEAKVPLAEMDRYSTKLQSLTQGRARFSMSFDSYETVNNSVFEKLVGQSKEEIVDA